ncbi:MAG: ABC transporter permease [Desulfuromonadaceae bacterium]|nr:ABC transporter permease [Desulfuromonadaceae bacterium]
MPATPRKYIILAYLLAGLILIVASYSLPLWLPGDFVTAAYSGSEITLTAVQAQELHAFYAHDQSLRSYMADVFTLKWGYSYVFQVPISELILEALPWTLVLMGSAHVLATVVGFIAGVEMAWRRGRLVEKLGVGGATVMAGVPELGVGVILLLVFSLHLGWFPAAGGKTVYADYAGCAQLLDLGRHLTLPLTTLFLAYLPANFFLTRGSMVLILGQQFLETARVKGLPPIRIRYAHAARNALLPLATHFGMRFAFMVTGAVVVETIFAYPGVGALLFNAITLRDLPLIQAIVLFSSLAVLAVNLCLEFIYAFLDPRVRYVS